MGRASENSPSSNPPPDKKASNDKAPPTSMMSKLKLVVSEASVLPPPLPPQLSEPTPPQQTSSPYSLSQRATSRPQSSRQPQTSTIEYQGVSHPQQTEGDEYPDVQVKNSGPAGAPLKKQAIQNPDKLTFTKLPACHLPMQNTKRTLVTKNARKIREAAVIISPDWLYETNMCPPNDDEHATRKKIPCFMSRPPRTDHTPVTEPAWLSGAVNLLPVLKITIWIRSTLTCATNSRKGSALLSGETFELHSRYSRDLKALLLLPKERLQRARYASLMDSTFLKITCSPM